MTQNGRTKLEDVITQVSYEEEEEFETVESYQQKSFWASLFDRLLCCTKSQPSVQKNKKKRKNHRRRKEPSFVGIFKPDTSTTDEDEDEEDEMGLMPTSETTNEDLNKLDVSKRTSKKKRIAQTTLVIRKQSQLRDSDDLRMEYCLLGPPKPIHREKKTLVLDLDETLVHSSFRKVPSADIIVHVEIEDLVNPVYVLKRPGVDEFLRQVGQLFEVVVFTASLSKYANPLLDQLDREGIIHSRLFREHCTFDMGAYKKDLSRLGRDISQVIIIDNSPVCYEMQPQNAIGVRSWFEDSADKELLSLLPWLHKVAGEKDVYDVLKEYQRWKKKWVISTF